MAEKFTIILESGTMDRLMAASILTAGAAAMGKEVTVFLTFGALMAFRRDAWKEAFVLPNEFRGMEDALARTMEAKGVPHWMQNFRDAREVGHVRFQACSATMEMFDLKLEHLEPIVDEVVGVAHFIAESEDAQTLFI